MKTIEQRLLARTENGTEVTSPHVDTPCWNCKYSTIRRYPGIKVNGISCKAHRVAYRLWVGGIPDGLHVLHKCDNTRCINPEHLFLGTHQDNINDMVKKERQAKGDAHKTLMKIFSSRGERHSSIMKKVAARGERQGLAKLTEYDVVFIRLWYEKGFTQQKIADAFSIERSNVGRIVNMKIWRHVL